MRLSILSVLIAVWLGADDILPKRVLKDNMQLRYLRLPAETTTLSDFFHQGLFYGRFRLNTFAFRWHKESTEHKNHNAVGLGGSLLYKSGYYKGLGFTVGLYTSRALRHIAREDAGFLKAAKGVLSRFDLQNSGKCELTSLAQAYIEYRFAQGSLKVGRQNFESLLTRSNDTKMVPNTFEGVSAESRYRNALYLKMGYFVKEKLRDHSRFHHILAYSGWQQNDDSAMHKGLTLAKLREYNIEDRMVVAEFGTRHRLPLQWLVNFTSVPRLLSFVAVEGGYCFGFGEGVYIKPALRYLRQFDTGVGKIASANLKNNPLGYRHRNDLDSSMVGMKVDVGEACWRLRFGYTKIADRADLITPWRGFPTGGYTRAMGQYNWYANTGTWMIRGDYDFDRAQIWSGVRAFFRYAVQDFDDTKPGVPADSDVLTLDIMKRFQSDPNLYAKIRMAYVNGKNATIAQDGTRKSAPSYHEVRFEINYLF